MKLEQLVNQYYESLNSNDKLVIKQILQHKGEYQYLSSEQIAVNCHISRATLLRLCRKIGLSSFSDLKYLLKESQQEQISGEKDFRAVCESYQLLMKELSKISYEPICEMIDKAETIYVYGTGNEQKSIAQELKQIFMSVGKCVIELFDLGEIEFIREGFKKNDLFIIISLSGETKAGIEVLRFIKNDIKTLSLTRLDNNTIASLCDKNLYVATQKLDPLETASYELVGVFYAILDFLFVNYMEYTRRLKR